MSSYRAYAVKRTGRKFIYITILRDGKFWKSRSSGKTVMREAQREAAELEAGLNSPNKETAEFGPITWSDFCDNYRVSEMLGMRESSRDKVDTVMRDVARIAKPYMLSDLTALKIADIVTEYRRGGAQETTIKSKVATLRAMLSWAKRVNMLDEIPAMPRVRAGTKSTAMKGRPLTEDEYAQLRSRAAALSPEWERFVIGLWLSGLRLAEAVNLTWDGTKGIRVDISGPRPVLLIYASDEKGRSDRTHPIAPDFAELLRQTPPEQRTGRVFKLPTQRVDTVSKRISEFGDKIIVSERSGKTASAHDLRRSFARRWADLGVPLHVVQALMRHSSIDLTVAYVGMDTRSAIDIANAAFSAARDAQSSTTPREPHPTPES